MRTFGEARLSARKAYWVLDVEPHVRGRLKALFPKIDPTEYGKVRVSCTPETCRDLEWFMQRWPLELDEKAAKALDANARAHEKSAETLFEVLNGQFRLPESVDKSMALPPRDYQKQAAALALETGGLLLADELGLGKTVSAITLIASGQLPALVVCPAHLPPQWKKELGRFVPGLTAHIVKKLEPYELADDNGNLPDVLVISYAKLYTWADHLVGKIKTVVFDEVQELRKTKSQKYKAARAIARKADLRLGLSATPIYNYGGEYYAVVDALRPGALGNKEEFLREWCAGYMDREKAVVKHPKVLGLHLREQAIMLRRSREDVSRELPELTRVVHEIETDGHRLREIESQATELAEIILSQGGGLERMQASSEFSNALRQATGIAKAPYVAEFVRMLLEQGKPVVLFGWHRVVYEIWGERLKKHKPAWYTGSESPAKKAREVERFTSGATNLLVMSLRSGAGVDGLQHRGSTVVIGELDWSPSAMDQCVGRIHREGQTAPVFAYYLTATDGVDPYMVDALGIKRRQWSGVKDPDADLVEEMQLDPDHVKKLAESYLRKRGRR